MNDAPLESFGNKLKEIRTKAKESIVDVSGAVEVDETFIKEIEADKRQPTEDIVLLLISHFALKEDEALQLWELAGYDQSKTGASSITADADGKTQKAYVTAGDVRILYTDMVHIKSNNHGLVINFLQNLGADDHTMAVARVGMSNEHAKTLLKVLKQTLEANKKASNNKDQPKKDS